MTNMYFTPGQGQTTPWGQFFFININILPICSFPRSFLQENDIFQEARLFCVSKCCHGLQLYDTLYVPFLTCPLIIWKELSEHDQCAMPIPAKLQQEDQWSCKRSPDIWAMRLKLTLTQNMSRSSKGDLCKLCRARFFDASCQVSKL